MRLTSTGQRFVLVTGIILVTLAACVPIPGAWIVSLPTEPELATLLPDSLGTSEKILVAPYWREIPEGVYQEGGHKNVMHGYGKPFTITGKEINSIPELIPKRFNYGIYWVPYSVGNNFGIYGIVLFSIDDGVFFVPSNIVEYRNSTHAYEWRKSRELGLSIYCKTKLSERINNNLIDQSITKYLPSLAFPEKNIYCD